MDAKESELAAAKEQALASGKEAFDFAKFAGLYPHDTGSRERLRPDEPDWIRAEYERKYYLDFPDVRTIEEFAGLLDSIDESD